MNTDHRDSRLPRPPHGDIGLAHTPATEHLGVHAPLGDHYAEEGVPTLQHYYNSPWPIGAISPRTEQVEADRMKHILAASAGSS